MADTSLIVCVDCSKEFSHMVAYRRHIKQHTRPYGCSQCPKRFALRTDLKRHQITHLSETPLFYCRFSDCLFKGTTREDYLMKHTSKVHKTPTPKRVRHYYWKRAPCEDLVGPALELRQALDNKNEASIKRLARDQPNIRINKGGTALHEAAAMGNEGLFRYLLEIGCDYTLKDKWQNTALDVAIISLKPEIIHIFSDFTADINNKPSRKDILHRAIERNCESIVKILVKDGRYLEAKDSDDSTPLLYTLTIARLSFTENIVKILVEAGANVEAVDRGGRTPLLNIVNAQGWIITGNIVKILLEAGANMEAVDRGGRTPLLNIVNAQGWFITDNIVKILLEAGANIEAVDRYGARALAYATGMASWNSYRPSTTKILLEAGAQIHNNVWEVLPQELKDKHGAQRNWKDGPPRRQFGGVWHK